MSPKLKRLSGSEVKEIFHTFGFNQYSQRGSHVKLRRIGVNGEKETLTIPLHSELDLGTLKAIIRQAAKYISWSDMRMHFYSD